MRNSNKYTRKVDDIVQFHFTVIAPVIQGLYSDASQTAYFKQGTEHPLVLPDGSSVKYSYKTPEKWVSLYRKDGLEALMPKERADKEKSRAFSDERIEKNCRTLQEFPRKNATQICEKHVRESHIPERVSVNLKKMNRIRHNSLDLLPA